MTETLRGDSEEEQPTYRPLIRFVDFGLLVSFDHSLCAKPEELPLVRRPVTTFVVHPDRELYVGLHFVPRSILSVVARGLKTYLQDEKLAEHQRALIENGASRLNRFVETGQRQP